MGVRGLSCGRLKLFIRRVTPDATLCHASSPASCNRSAARAQHRVVGYAYSTGEVLVQSDGTPWRPLLHVNDIAAAFLAVLHAPHELVHDQAFNVAARTVSEISPRSSRTSFLARAPRSPRLAGRTSFISGRPLGDRAHDPRVRASVTVRRGVEQLYEAYARNRLTFEEFTGTRYLRIKLVRELQEAGRLDGELRWRLPVVRGG
jgi:hypothetical protein